MKKNIYISILVFVLLLNVKSTRAASVLETETNVSFRPNNLELKIPKDTTVCDNVAVTFKALLSGVASLYTYSRCLQGKTCSALPEPVYPFDVTTQVVVGVTASDLFSTGNLFYKSWE